MSGTETGAQPAATAPPEHAQNRQQVTAQIDVNATVAQALESAG